METLILVLLLAAPQRFDERPYRRYTNESAASNPDETEFKILCNVRNAHQCERDTERDQQDGQ